MITSPQNTSPLYERLSANQGQSRQIPEASWETCMTCGYPLYECTCTDMSSIVETPWENCTYCGYTQYDCTCLESCLDCGYPLYACTCMDGTTYMEDTTVMPTCMYCGYPEESCTCMNDTTVMETCTNCHNLIDECSCTETPVEEPSCPGCGSKPPCEICTQCHDKPYKCKCQACVCGNHWCKKKECSCAKGTPGCSGLKCTCSVLKANTCSTCLNPKGSSEYFNFRHYNPHDGRWISRDPIAEQSGWNLYGFVENDPVGKWDILGKDIKVEYTSAAGGHHERVCSTEWEELPPSTVTGSTPEGEGSFCCLNRKWYKEKESVFYCISFAPPSHRGALDRAKDLGNGPGTGTPSGLPSVPYPPGFKGSTNTGDHNGIVYEDNKYESKGVFSKHDSRCCKESIASFLYLKGLVGGNVLL